MPYISEQYRPKVKTKTEEKRSQILSVPRADLRGRHIDLAPWPEYFDDRGIVHFQDSGRPEAERMKNATVKPDIVILATGYKQVFPFLDEAYSTPDEADIRRVWRSGNESLAFIGFVRPGLGRRTGPLLLCQVGFLINQALTITKGAIPPMAEMQAQLWIANLLGRSRQPLRYEDDYPIKTPGDRRIQYGVDYESYM